MKRVVVYPKDVMIITGKSERYSRYLIKRIKKHFKKEDHQVVTVQELCAYLGLDENRIEQMII